MAGPNPLFDALILREGTDWSATWTITDSAGVPLVWTGATVACMFRADMAQAAADLSLTSTPAAGITLAAGGLLTLAVSKTQIAALIASTGAFGLRLRGHFAVVMTDSGGAHLPLIEGIVQVRRSATR